MRYSKWIGVLAFVVLLAVSYMPWVYIESKGITVTGLNAAGTNFGKPALLSLVLGVVATILFIIPYTTAKRANLFFCALNLAWAIRNFIVLSTCRQGDCPQKETALYLMLAASIIMLAAALFPDVELKSEP
ncbi:MAG: hypothetical protein INR73_28090 [Williamsia sp.]|nr:hypothetical protein [Williamsia sp.]